MKLSAIAVASFHAYSGTAVGANRPSELASRGNRVFSFSAVSPRFVAKNLEVVLARLSSMGRRCAARMASSDQGWIYDGSATARSGSAVRMVVRFAQRAA